MGMIIVRVWADLASDQFLDDSTESPSKNFRSRKFLMAAATRMSIVGFFFGGPVSQAISFYMNQQNRHPKLVGPENF